MLENKKVGFLGAGMMAEAIARGLLNTGVNSSSMIASDPDAKRRELFSRELGINVTEDNKSVVRFADVIVLAVKPFVVPGVADELADEIRADQLLISIAAGVTTESLSGRLKQNVPVVRVMPNTPCLIGEGASALAPGKFAGPEHLETALSVFSAVGRAVQTTEDKIDAVTGLSGSGPAYVYMFIEALADGGVRMGLPRATALMLAAQTVAGAARMVLETNMHPGELKDKVTTPGGTTIAGIATLERAAFRSAAIEAVTAATNRSAELGKASTG